MTTCLSFTTKEIMQLPNRIPTAYTHQRQVPQLFLIEFGCSKKG